MKATQKLQEMGQSLWLDNITRGLLSSGTLRRYIQESRLQGSPQIPRSSITPSRIATTTMPLFARK